MNKGFKRMRVSCVGISGGAFQLNSQCTSPQTAPGVFEKMRRGRGRGGGDGLRNDLGQGLDFSGDSVVKSPPGSAEDAVLIPGPGRSRMPWSS